jgi:hypothetical protein
MNANKIKKFYTLFRDKMTSVINEAFGDNFDADKYVKCYNGILYSYTGIENYVTLKNNSPEIYDGQVSLSKELLSMFKNFEDKDLLFFIEEKFKNDKKMKSLIEKIPIVKNSKFKKEVNTVCYYVMLEAIVIILGRDPNIFSD